MNKKSFSISDVGHAALDVGGLIPGVGEAFDLTNALLYIKSGDFLGAIFSLLFEDEWKESKV